MKPAAGVVLDDRMDLPPALSRSGDPVGIVTCFLLVAALVLMLGVRCWVKFRQRDFLHWDWPVRVIGNMVPDVRPVSRRSGRPRRPGAAVVAQGIPMNLFGLGVLSSLPMAAGSELQCRDGQSLILGAWTCFL